MIHVREVRALALALPGTSEEDHHGKPSFRVCGRIFATLPDGEHLNVMVEPLAVDGAVQEDPASCQPLYRGKEVRGVRLRLRVATPELARDLIAAAWRQKAPHALVAKTSTP